MSSAIKNAAKNLHNNYTSFLRSLQSDSHIIVIKCVHFVPFCAFIVVFFEKFYLCKFFSNIRLNVTTAIVNHIPHTKKFWETERERMVKHCIEMSEKKNWKFQPNNELFQYFIFHYLCVHSYSLHNFTCLHSIGFRFLYTKCLCMWIDCDALLQLLKCFFKLTHCLHTHGP